jgi:hypothetical protein
MIGTGKLFEAAASRGAAVKGRDSHGLMLEPIQSLINRRADHNYLLSIILKGAIP